MDFSSSTGMQVTKGRSIHLMNAEKGNNIQGFVIPQVELIIGEQKYCGMLLRLQ